MLLALKLLKNFVCGIYGCPNVIVAWSLLSSQNSIVVGI